jgi:hypothetical protein
MALRDDTELIAEGVAQGVTRGALRVTVVLFTVATFVLAAITGSTRQVGHWWDGYSLRPLLSRCIQARFQAVGSYWGCWPQRG